MSNEPSLVTGPLPAALGNAVSDAIHSAASAGMEMDEACCIAAAVIADYARGTYGDRYLPALAAIITRRAGQPLPGEHHNG